MELIAPQGLAVLLLRAVRRDQLPLVGLFTVLPIGALFLSAGGYHHHLGTNTWATGAAPAGEGDARLLEWEVRVPRIGDAKAALASLEKTGGTVETAVDGGVVRDPWGTAVRVRSDNSS